MKRWHAVFIAADELLGRGKLAPRQQRASQADMRRWEPGIQAKRFSKSLHGSV
jgi:hypothetical protein